MSMMLGMQLYMAHVDLTAKIFAAAKKLILFLISNIRAHLAILG